MLGVFAALMLLGDSEPAEGEHESTNCAEEENVMEVVLLALIVSLIGGPVTSDMVSDVDSSVEGHVCDVTCVT